MLFVEELKIKRSKKRGVCKWPVIVECQCISWLCLLTGSVENYLLLLFSPLSISTGIFLLDFFLHNLGFPA